MVTELIITEKPSAAKKIAEALSDKSPEKRRKNTVNYFEITRGTKKILVVSAVGHLFTVAEKKKKFTYPSFEIDWKASYLDNKDSAYTKNYAEVIRDLAKTANSFIVACDYDVEGEVIGLNVIRFLCNQKDAKRMKFSTLTKPDLVESYENLSKTLDWGQAKAGETRHFLDWMYGINLSRALTLSIRKNKVYKTMSSGRVQGPALKILSDKEKEIGKFVPKKYWQIEFLGKSKKHNIEAWHEKDKFWEEKDAKKSYNNAKGKEGVVKDMSKTDATKPAPFPFDLTTLQTEGYSCFGYTPKHTLDLAQSLYVKGYISYPRTSSQELTPKIGFNKIMTELAKQKNYTILASELLSKKNLKPNNGTKTDPAHPAIYPTGIAPKSLESMEAKVYDLIVKRFFATFSESATRQTTTAKIDVNSEIFIAKGTRTVKEGWFRYYAPYVKLKETEFPPLSVSDVVKQTKLELVEKETQPPKRFTQASIIKELESRGLGTKATRAQIIQNLIDREYVDGKSIEVTELGMKTVETLSKYCAEILDDNFTREIEEGMEKIREDKETPKHILDQAKKDLEVVLHKFKENELKIGKELSESYIETEREKNSIGTCLGCGGTLMIKKSIKNKSRFIACSAYPDCTVTFSIPQKGVIKALDKPCEHCKYPMINIRSGKKSQNVCINPKCSGKKMSPEIEKDIKEIEKNEVEQECPKCKVGRLVVRKSVYGKFLGCNNFPKCRYTQNIDKEMPLKEDFSKNK